MSDVVSIRGDLVASMGRHPAGKAAAADPGPGVDLTALRWRTGRTVGRTVYAVVGDAASDGDMLLTSSPPLRTGIPSAVKRLGG